jgi:hypothetical protein
MRRRVNMILLTGILIFGVILLLDFDCIGSQSNSYAEIWVDRGCNSTYSDGDAILVNFQIISPASSATVTIIDYTTEGETQYLIENQTMSTNIHYYFDGIVRCPEGLETLEIRAKVVVNETTRYLKDTCDFHVVGCSGYGYIRIHSNVTEYDVWLDGKHILTEGVWSAGGGGSTAPYPDGICEFSVTPGSHEIELRKEKYDSYTISVSVNAGELKEFYIIMELDEPDNDGDGYSPPSDCNDNDARIYPGAPEICDDAKDNDCDGYTDCSDPDCNTRSQCNYDKDDDGYNSTAYGGDDCNDNDSDVNPGAPENCNDAKDNDCDGYTDCSDSDCAADSHCDHDKDDDGYNSTAYGGDDCNDNDSDVNPGAPEICNDAKDNDCDGNTDCSDSDCEADSHCDHDKDDDGYNSTAYGGDDCNDNDSDVNPGAPENCNDAKDNDCDGNTDCSDSGCKTSSRCDQDRDDDGYNSTAYGGDDCNDNDSDVNPGAPETCDDAKDNDCDGYTDCSDSDCAADSHCDHDKDDDGYNSTAYGGDDCNDNDSDVNPGAPEDCDDAKDNDCDGYTDCSDSGCKISSHCEEKGNLEILVTSSEGKTLEGASIYVNRAYRGKTDSTGTLLISNLEADKEYIVDVEAPRHETNEETITVVKNITKSVVVQMKKNTDFGVLIGLMLFTFLVPVFLIYELKIKKRKKTQVITQSQICPKCGNIIQKNAPSCPHCRATLKDETIVYDEETRLYSEDGKTRLY